MNKKTKLKKSGLQELITMIKRPNILRSRPVLLDLRLIALHLFPV